jgi:multicomponent Na+:H+ antiporter subunit G
MTDLLSAVLLVAGTLLALIAAVALWHFPGIYARLHAAGKPTTLGAVLILSGAALRMSDPADAIKLILVAVFQLLTTPLGAHFIGRAARRSGQEMSSDQAPPPAPATPREGPA